MVSGFQLNLYTFLVFFNTLMKPIALGFACLVMLYFAKRSVIRELSFSLLLIMTVAIISQLFITSTGPRSFELFYVPGAIAAPLLILLLATAHGASSMNSFKVASAVAAAFFLVRVAPRVESESITAASLTLVFVVGYCTVTWIRNGRMRSRTATEPNFVALAVSLFVILVAIISFVDRDFPNLPQYAKPFPDRLDSDWYGTPLFIETANFIEENTKNEDLFAYSVCQPTAEKTCEPDFRPAALTRRQYLAHNAQFSEADVDERTWQNIELSRSIGTGAANQVMQQLRDRKVDYVLAERVKVSDGWIESATSSGSVEIYRNAEYIVLKLSSDSTIND
jgi:hypothetical protein